MFKVEKDRLNYSRILKAPEGFEFESAVCTTYSMSLDMLSNAVMALGLGESFESELLRRNPMCLLSAVQKVCGSLLVFCEAGRLDFQGKAEPVAALFERSITQVTLPRKTSKGNGGYPSFHPKMWLIKYKNAKEGPLYRLIVLSRNLTYDKSWDVCTVIEGVRDAKQKSNAKPLADFLKFLSLQITGEFKGDDAKRRQIALMKDELSTVIFRSENVDITDIDILPIGIGNGGCDIKSSALLNSPAQSLIVVSPFLTESIVSKFNSCAKTAENGHAVLITRRGALDGLPKAACSSLQAYVLKEPMVQYEKDDTGQETAPGANLKSDIHAKLYIRESGIGKKTNVELYLGSMNATQAGVTQNIEFMVRIAYAPGSVTAMQILSEIFCGQPDAPGNPFEAAEPAAVSVEDTNELEYLERQIKEICRCGANAKVEYTKGQYNLYIFFPRFEKNINVIISPIMKECPKPIESTVIFTGMKKLELSQFYRIVVKGPNMEVERVILIPTKGLPQDTESTIISHYIADANAFMKYIYFIFSERKLSAAITMDETARCGVWKNSHIVPVAVYETMMRAAVVNPERFKDCMTNVASLMKVLKDKGEQTSEFQKLYTAFEKAGIMGQVK